MEAERETLGMRPRPGGRLPVGVALGDVFSGAFREGWQNLLELVLLGLIWFLCVLSVGLALVARTLLAHGAGLLIALGAVLLPLALVGPATVGLFGAVDAIWAGEAIGPFDALRNFFRGFGRRYLRSVGLGVLWGVVLLSLYANTVEDKQLLPRFMIVGVGILLLYIVLFVVMVSTYVIPILALTEWSIWRAIRVGAWQAVANPLYTISLLLVPAGVVIVGTSLRPLLPLLAGGSLALFSTGALRGAPLRHPDLPAPTTVRGPLGGDEDLGLSGAGAPAAAEPSQGADGREAAEPPRGR